MNDKRLGQLMQGVGADIQRYRELLGLLESQFQATLRHEAASLAGLADTVTALVATLDDSRRERGALVHGLLGPKATMADAIALLDSPKREALETGWRSLEALVRESKRLNARNCQLLMDQHALLQRVLHGEDATYAPT